LAHTSELHILPVATCKLPLSSTFFFEASWV
jgi:hypothetical protein